MTEQDILIMNSDSTHVDVELSFDNGINTIKNNKIYSESMSLIDSISDSESIVFGKCNVSQFKVKVADFDGDIDGALMNVLLKFSNAELGTCEYKLGQYIVSDSERTSDKMFRVITAYDKMSLFNADIANWYNYTLFPFEVVDNNLGWLPVNENGVVIDLTYSIAGEPQTSLDKNDDGAYYLNTNDGTVYVGYATYDESGEFASVEWRAYLQCEKNESYTESCNVTRTVSEILAMLCEYVGVSYNTDFVLVNGGVVVKRDFNPQSLNGIDFLQQICELNGVFGHINNNGILDFIAPDKSTKQTVDTFKKCDYSEYTVQPINSVSIKYDSNDMGTAVTRPGIEKLNQYEIVGNIFLQSVKTENELKTIAGNILSIIENVSYVPCSIEVKCGLNLELGDCITVNAKTIKEESVSSVSFDTLVLCRNISGIQSIFNRIEAKGTEYVSKSSESLASQLQITNKTIDKLYKDYTANIANFMYLYSKAITTDSLTANIANIGTLNANSAFVKFLQTNVVDANYIRAVTAEIGYLTADSAIISSLQTDKLNTSDLNAENAKLGYLTAGSAVITGKLDANQLSAEVAKLGYLDAKMANIDFANLNKANIGQLFANVGLISSATITDGHVTGYLDSVEVNANKITAGTLAVDRLLIKDSSGNYKMATYDSSGNLVTTTVNGSVITNRTITADHLVAGTITANEIAVGTITADKIAAGTITADKINLNDLFAQNITASGTITGAHLVGSSGEFSRFMAIEGDFDNGDYGQIGINEMGYTPAGGEREIIHGIYIDQQTPSGINNSINLLGQGGIQIKTAKNNTVVSGIDCNVDGTLKLSGKVSVSSVGTFSSPIIYENGTVLSDKYLGINANAVSATALSSEIANDKLPYRLQSYHTSNIADTTACGFNYVSSGNPFGTGSDFMTISQGYSSAWGSQIATDFRSNNMAVRCKNNGTWSDWATVITDKRIGKATVDGTNYYSYIGNVEGEDIGIGNGRYYYVISLGHYSGGNYSSQIAMPYEYGISDSDMYIRTAKNATWRPWRKVIHSGNIGSQSVNYATSSGNADTVDGHHFNWSGQSGQPTWVWGGNDSSNMYVYNPSNFSVSYANNAGFIPTRYDGGQRYNPLQYFNESIGLKVAMTGLSNKGTSYWCDTLWINGYSGSDVHYMCAIHTNRDGTPRAFISSQSNRATEYGTLYEFITAYNIGSQSVNYANTAGSAPASDVYSWAKQSTKPSYALNEITGSSDIFKIVTYSYNSVSVASGSSATVTPSRTNIPSGYTAVAVYTVNSGGGRIYPRAHSADGTIVLVNESSTATVTPSMKVLCVKSNCVG